MASGSPDPESIRLALVETRRTHDNRLEKLQEFDDKAMRTVRTSVIITGFVVSAGAVGGIEAMDSLSEFALAFGITGTASLFVSAFIGVGAYTISKPPLGIGRDRRAAAFVEDRETWNKQTLRLYDDWQATLSDQIERNAVYLLLSNMALLLGTLVLLLAAATAISHQVFGMPAWVVPTAFLVIDLLIILTAQALMRATSNT